jgi:peptidoglycan/xylan/chitin deacetylase (PgdA/CDA1 family)
MPMIVALAAAVFMYHHVSPSVQPGKYARALTVTPQEFGDQLAWLRARGCVIVHASAIVDDARAGVLAPCEVALTFDDGYDDAAAFAVPLLTQVGATATFFIATGEVGSRGHLTVADLHALDELGMELAAHTVHHVDLVRATVSARDAEIAGSVAMLRAWTGRRVTGFAYPSGRYDSGVERSVAAAGVRYAFTTYPGVINGSTIRDIYAIPRYRVIRGSGISLFKAVLGAGLSTVGTAAAHTESALLPARSDAALAAVARERIEGNDQPAAERIGISLLREEFREPIEKIRVLTVPAASVAGIMLSGSGLREPVTGAQFAADASAMAALALSAAPRVSEVDVWATIPLPVAKGTIVAGDMAAPTERTVLSVSVRRGAPASRAFIDAEWAAHLSAPATAAAHPRR